MRVARHRLGGFGCLLSLRDCVMGRLPPQLEHLIAIELRLKKAKIEMESLRDKVAEAERRLKAQAP